MGGGTGNCLISSFLLFRTRYVRYYMAFWCMCFMRFFITICGIFKLASLLMECSCIASLTPVGLPTLVLYVCN